MKLSSSEVARYLGYGGAPLSEELLSLAETCECDLLSGTKPRRLGRRMRRADLPFESSDLETHLKDCEEVFLTAVTLGGEADRLLRLWSAQNMAKATIGQALAAVYMDDCCDAYLLDLESHLQEGEYLLPAYSPGYGDFSLSYQETLLRLLDAPRRIGLTLTAGGMLVPEKSVTAVVGITKTPTRRCAVHCHSCTMPTCPFRKGS